MGFVKNELVSVQITDIGTEGEGIGHVDGYTLFVKGAVVGDTVTAKILKDKKKYGYAKVEKVETPSPFRAEAPCPVSRRCGGCQLQTTAYEGQLQLKEGKVRNNLLRIGGFSEKLLDEIMEPILGMDGELAPFRYRNKAQYPVGTDSEGNVVVGFYAERSHAIIPCEDCLLGPDHNQNLLQAVLDYMKQFHVPAYDETTGKGLIRHILIREGFSSGEIMVCLVINGQKLPEEKKLIESILAAEVGGCRVTSICVSSNTKQTNVILGDNYKSIYGQDYIRDRIGNVAFRISPLSFYQVNPAQTVRLYETALEYAQLTGTEKVWDLYCGIGTISLFLAQKAGKVYGVEIVPQAIENAKENAMINGFSNTEFLVGKAEEVLPEYYRAAKTEDEMNHPDVIVVDPPRKGCDELCLQTMVSMKPERIVYVSCDSATLARDLKYLCKNGYELKRVRPCDMFPQTVHVETVALLGRKKSIAM